jgi:peptidoglycan/LPS O-acetylase OafA/YrhL
VKYRADIDGLRALAVVPVVLFHAGFSLFSGGFVGVDVFLVVSGYLITTILLEDIENNRYSILRFYERRARRILPALFFVMLVCIPFAWMWMLPIQLKDFSQSLVAVSLFVSNILFWQESGYFAAAAAEKPLLHTWSLAVEEQYYLLFPIFLFLAWRFGRNRVFWMIVVFAAISLALSEWGWRNNPHANFYLALTRAWELFAGSIAAFIVQKRGVQSNNVLSLLGLAAIIFAVFVYDDTTPFPSVYALVPVIGVVLLVLYGDRETLAAKILSTRVFVGIGLISYSAYLWHQPLFSFARIRLLEEPSTYLMGFLSLASFALAVASWKFIEKPFRNSSIINRDFILNSSLIGLLSFVIIGYVGYNQDGFKGRFKLLLQGDVGHLAYHGLIDKEYFDCEPASVAKGALNWEGFLRCKQTQRGDADWILLGDSHAEHLFLGLAEAHRDKNIVFYILDGEPYLWNHQYANIFDFIKSSQKKKKILLTMYYASRVDDVNVLKNGFGGTIEYLQNLGHEVVLVGDIPRYEVSPEDCVYGNSIEFVSKFCSIKRSEFEQQRDIYEQTLVSLADKFGVQYATIHESLCNKATCSMVKDDFVLYRDDNHLNIRGSQIVGRYLASKLSGRSNPSKANH